MEQYSRPATLADHKALVSSLNQQEAEYLLIGGHALFAHGTARPRPLPSWCPRPGKPGNASRQCGWYCRTSSACDVDPAWFVEGENIRVADAFVVDIMLDACGETDETLKQFA